MCFFSFRRKNSIPHRSGDESRARSEQIPIYEILRGTCGYGEPVPWRCTRYTCYGDIPEILRCEDTKDNRRNKGLPIECEGTTGGKAVVKNPMH